MIFLPGEEKSESLNSFPLTVSSSFSLAPGDPASVGYDLWLLGSSLGHLEQPAINCSLVLFFLLLTSLPFIIHIIGFSAFLITLLKCDLRIIKFTHRKCTIQLRVWKLNELFKLFLNLSITPVRFCLQLMPVPALSLRQPKSTSCVYRCAFSGHSMQMELYSIRLCFWLFSLSTMLLFIQLVAGISASFLFIVE